MALSAVPPRAQELVSADAMGGPGLDRILDLVVDDAGNVFVTGSFSGTADFDPGPGVFNLTAAGSRDLFVAKYGEAGGLAWAKVLSSAADNASAEIAVDGFGNVCLAGRFSDTVDFDPGPGSFHLTSSGSFDPFVVKLDGDGNFQWASATGGSGFDGHSGIAVDEAGDIYTIGFFNGTVDFDPGPGVVSLTSAGAADVVISKWDGAGGLLWAKRVGGSSTDIGNGIAVDDAGNVHAIGLFGSVVDFDPGAGVFTLPSSGFDDIFVLKLDTGGNFDWARKAGSSLLDSGNEIAVDAAGNVFATGYFRGVTDFDPGAGIFTLTANGARDAFVWKLSSSGEFEWARGMGGGVNDTGYGIAVDGCGAVYTTGYFTGTVDLDPAPTVFTLTSGSSGGSFLWKLDQGGNFVWASGVGGAAPVSTVGVSVSASGRVHTAGNFSGTVDFDPGAATFAITSAGDRDAFVAEYGQSSFPVAVTRVNVGHDPLTGAVLCDPDPAKVLLGGCVEFFVASGCPPATISAPGLFAPISVAPGSTSLPRTAGAGGIFSATVTLAPPGSPQITGSCELRVIRTLVGKDGSPVEAVAISATTPTMLDVWAPADSTYVAALSDACQSPGVPVSSFIPLLELDLQSALFAATAPTNLLSPFVTGLQGTAGSQQILLMTPPLPPGFPPITTYLQVVSLSPVGLSGLSCKVQLSWGP